MYIAKRVGPQYHNSLFVGNLDFKATEEDIIEILKQYGKFEVNIHKTKSGKPLGYAHVNF